VQLCHKNMKVYFLHPHIHDLQSMGKYLKITLPSNVVWDSEAPEILFVSEWIYYKSSYYKEFKRLWSKAKLRVFFAGEAIEPDFNLFDYAVGFDSHLDFDGRFIRLPSPIHFFTRFIERHENEISSKESALALLKEKTGFCSFLYSNPNAHPMRDRLFYEISKYRKVDSLGRHLNNVGKKGTGYVGHASEGIDIKANYKFSIACENASYDGYTSEKVFTSLLAHTVPIYWGNKLIAEDVNPKAIISVRDYDSIDALIEYVRFVDTHDDVWSEMVSQPWMTPEQLAKHEERTRHYIERMNWLFDGRIEDKVRIAHGTHTDFYRTNYLGRVFPLQINRLNYVTYLKRILR